MPHSTKYVKTEEEIYAIIFAEIEGITSYELSAKIANHCRAYINTYLEEQVTLEIIDSSIVDENIRDESNTLKRS